MITGMLFADQLRNNTYFLVVSATEVITYGPGQWPRGLWRIIGSLLAIWSLLCRCGMFADQWKNNTYILLGSQCYWSNYLRTRPRGLCRIIGSLLAIRSLLRRCIISVFSAAADEMMMVFAWFTWCSMSILRILLLCCLPVVCLCCCKCTVLWN